MANILDCFLHWNVPADAQVRLVRADAIAAHEFGDQRVPSVSTAAIVMWCCILSKKLGKPLICQFPGDEVAEGGGLKPILVIRKHELNPGAYLDTHEVNRQIAWECAARRWRRVIVCSHPHHLWRAGEDLRKQGVEPLYSETSGIPYDRLCSRSALGNPLRYIPREIAARLMYQKNGWI